VAAAPEDVLERIAATLREQVGPSVGDSFARTQAFMASVILMKLAAQLRSEAEGGTIAHEERVALVGAMRHPLVGREHPALDVALQSLTVDGSDRAWSAVVAALHAEREQLGDTLFDELLRTLRAGLRRRLDRALLYAS
jgi:hypothetical protein